jgi:hypothetical protein
MIFFSIILIVPLLVTIGVFFISGKVCWKEFSIMCGVQVIVAVISAVICYYVSTSDTEVWNGVVVDKQQVRVSCSHSYSCNCRQSCSGFGKNRSCRTVCSTCYEHFNDWDWRVFTSNKESITINRVDRRGSYEPPRFSSVVIGEPTAVTHTYENYIKAAPDTLFRHQGLVEKYEQHIPDYPIKIYDYYRLNRLTIVNSAVVENIDSWNEDLSRISSKLGATHQVNVVVVVVNNLPKEFYYAIEQAWIGAKKNDVVLVIGVNGQTIKWAEVMTWTTNELFKIKLRDQVIDVGTMDRKTIIDALSTTIPKYYKRKSMEDFEYLKSSITPTTTQWITTLLIGLMISIGLSWFFHQNETFPEYRNHRYGMRNRYQF